jgi:hypothetical protein
VETSGNGLRRLVKYRLISFNTETGELGWHSKAIEEDMTKRLHNDLKL